MTEDKNLDALINGLLADPIPKKTKKVELSPWGCPRIILPKLRKAICCGCGITLHIDYRFAIFRCPDCRAKTYPCGRCRRIEECVGQPSCPLNDIWVTEACVYRMKTGNQTKIF